MTDLLEALMAAVLILLVLFACASSGNVTSDTTFLDVKYDARLTEVERPKSVEERYGDYEVVERDTAQGQKYVYKDNLITAGFVLLQKSIFVAVENKVEQSIQIQLGEGAFVGPDGSSERLLTGEMSYMERNNAPPPVVIPSGASSSARLIPASNVEQETVTSVISPGTVMRDSTVTVERDTLYKATTASAEENVGKTFSLLIPVEIQGTRNEYTFTFTVQDFSTEESFSP